jgi:hypothetical protein
MCHTRAGPLLDAALSEYCAVAAAVCGANPVLTTLMTTLGSAWQQIVWAMPTWLVQLWGFFGSLPSIGLSLGSLFAAAKMFGFALPWGLIAPLATQVAAWTCSKVWALVASTTTKSKDQAGANTSTALAKRAYALETGQGCFTDTDGDVDVDMATTTTHNSQLPVRNVKQE